MARVTMPQLGESVAEGTIGKWLKQPGDHVAKYEPLLEVITDKVNAEVPSPFEGTLVEILVEEGATVPNNAEIAVIAETGSTDATAETGSTDATAGAHGPAGSDERPGHREPANGHTEPGAAPTSTSASTAAPRATSAPATSAPAASARTALAGDPDARMTPAVRRLLREHGLTAAQIAGTGGGGRITRDDVLAIVEAIRTGHVSPAAAAATTPSSTSSSAAASPAAAKPSSPSPAAPGPATAPPSAQVASTVVFPPGADELLLPMTQMRKGIAAQMTRALAVPHAYVHVEVDLANLVRLRESAKGDYQAREGIGLSYVPFVVKACVEALRRRPTLNAHWTDAGLLAKRRINVGVAVAVDDGLIVPVIRDVDQLSINGLNHAIADVATRARANKLRLDDVGGGTFTVDNTGWLGSNLTMPIINVPEVAILTMEAITKRPIVVESAAGDMIAIRPIMNMVLGIDHRANDGAGATAFLRDVKASLEAIGPETAIN